MLFRGPISIAIAGLLASMATAQAFDDAKYPDLFGVWRRVNLRPGGQTSFDPTKAWGRGQQAPLTPEYQAIHEASLTDQANGGQGNWQSGARCMPPGMPASMNVHREPGRQPSWREVICAENNNHVEIGKQNYMLGPDGRLMPTRKDQPPPDLRYFNRSRTEGPQAR
jgi:hypothetical protein